MQHEVTDVQKLLDKQGYVVTPGWARRPVWQYNRENIAAPSFRIKEWDYYLAGNEHYAVAFTLSDLGYAGLISVSLIDLVERKEHTETILTAMPMGRMDFRPSATARSISLSSRKPTPCLAAILITGTPVSFSRRTSSTEMSLFSASSVRFRQKITFSVSSIICRPKGRLRSREVASRTTRTMSGCS